MSPVSSRDASGSEEWRFEAALHAMSVYQRARLIRRLAVMVTVVITATQFVLMDLCPPRGETTIPVLAGVGLLASFFSISLEWSARRQCRDSLDEFYVRDTRDETSS